MAAIEQLHLALTHIHGYTVPHIDFSSGGSNRSQPSVGLVLIVIHYQCHLDVVHHPWYPEKQLGLSLATVATGNHGATATCQVRVHWPLENPTDIKPVYYDPVWNIAYK